MPFKSKKEKLKLSENEKLALVEISKSRTKSLSEIERAKILLAYADNKSISAIAREFNTNRVKVNNCVNKALMYGVKIALKDLPRTGKPATITTEAKQWLVSIACTKPKDLGYAQEFWTLSLLATYLRENCEAVGHGCLRKIQKGTVSKILNNLEVKPHKMSYYLVKKDPDFQEKMNKVLHVYKEVELYNESPKKEKVNILSYDEKPGIQAIENIAVDLAPSYGTHKTWNRDYEYKRHGTLSLLASIDLITGKIVADVRDRHRSIEFIEFLEKVNKSYDPSQKIKIILDNHSSHISKETKKYLSTIPNRFEFVFTPKHASWLNMIEIFFSKMARSFLRGIRVKSKDELKERILKYIDEVNEMPTIFKWKWKMDEL